MPSGPVQVLCLCLLQVSGVLSLSDSSPGVPQRVHDRDSDTNIVVETLRIQPGHDAEWSRPDFDDSAWEDAVEWYFSPRADTTLEGWIRMGFRLGGPDEAVGPLGLRISALASYELFLDGHSIGSSGRVGTSVETEEPGPIDRLFLVPDSLVAAGEHVLAMHFSNHHVRRRVRYYFYDIEFGSFERLVREQTRAILLPLLFLGGFGIIGIYYLLLFLVTNRKLSFLLFSLLCFSVMMLLVAEGWRWFFGYTFDHHYTRLLAVEAATFISAFLLGYFFLIQFDVRRVGLWTGALAVLLLAGANLPVGFDVRNLVMLSLATLVATGVGVWAVARRKEGSLFALAGVGISLPLIFVSPGIFSDYTFFLSFGALIVCLLASLAVQGRKQREAHEAAVVSAVRLETELLKRNMQPHFLMNSLTSVMEWIEEDPDTGVRLIEALADEFRILLEVSDKPLIPIAMELDLCRSHLVTMSLRSDVEYTLREENVDHDEHVPPALFLTLVENGITHRRGRGNRVQFRLVQESHGNGRTYVFFAPGEGPIPHSTSDGVGLRYIRARLRESYGSDWSLSDGPEAGGWMTRINILA